MDLMDVCIILLMVQKSGVNQLRLVVYPIIYRVLYIYIYIHISQVVVNRISAINFTENDRNHGVSLLLPLVVRLAEIGNPDVTGHPVGRSSLQRFVALWTSGWESCRPPCSSIWFERVVCTSRKWCQNGRKKYPTAKKAAVHNPFSLIEKESPSFLEVVPYWWTTSGEAFDGRSHGNKFSSIHGR